MYNLVAIGGTFDRLHAGHIHFLTHAFNVGERVIIGLTSDLYLDKLKINPPYGGKNLKINVGSFAERKRVLAEFLREKGWEARVQIVPIDDIYGPAVLDDEIEAIVVTADSRKGAEAINAERERVGKPALKIVEVTLQPAEDHKTISSTRIRMGEIDRWGHVLSELDIFNKPITHDLRMKLKVPQGELIPGTREDLHKVVPRLREIVAAKKPAMIITVGDEVTRLANDLNLAQVLSIVDFKVERKAKYKTLQELGFGFSWSDAPSNIFLQSVRNTAGIISHRLVMAIRRAIKMHFSLGTRHIIRVIGEDDLAGIPAIILAPLGALVLYGQPGEGIVCVYVTEEKKQMLLLLLG